MDLPDLEKPSQINIDIINIYKLNTESILSDPFTLPCNLDGIGIEGMKHRFTYCFDVVFLAG